MPRKINFKFKSQFKVQNKQWVIDKDNHNGSCDCTWDRGMGDEIRISRRWDKNSVGVGGVATVGWRNSLLVEGEVILEQGAGGWVDECVGWKPGGLPQMMGLQSEGLAHGIRVLFLDFQIFYFSFIHLPSHCFTSYISLHVMFIRFLSFCVLFLRSTHCLAVCVA